jgi:hypothetical protein
MVNSKKVFKWTGQWLGKSASVFVTTVATIGRHAHQGESRTEILFPCRKGAGEQPLFGKQMAPRTAPSAELEEAALMPVIIQRLRQTSFGTVNMTHFGVRFLCMPRSGACDKKSGCLSNHAAKTEV